MVKTRNKKSSIQKTLKIKKLPNKTPLKISALSQKINSEIIQNQFLPRMQQQQASAVNSYSPTINEQLVTLKSAKRENMFDCNNTDAFKLDEPLEIGIPGTMFGTTCVPYYSDKAIRYLLKNLSANKHIEPNKIVPPIQSMSNCWFNTMFITLFISDKGRKFFHFFRQLMIQGKQANNKEIPDKLRNAFALLNYAIEATLTGSRYAYMLDTNTIIKGIYDNIPSFYLTKFPYLKNIQEAGNPFYYYASLMNYLDTNYIDFLLIQTASSSWKDIILKDLEGRKHTPHMIILEITDNNDYTAGMSGIVSNKPISFIVKNKKYVLDSCVIRDTTQQHFCATLTCEKKQMAYDGLSFHRLVNLEWKQHINSNFVWQFDGSNNIDGTPLNWNFRHGYQMLFYYRTK
jgi:hypothetical protein